jgi:hypothetical protein
VHRHIAHIGSPATNVDQSGPIARDYPAINGKEKERIIIGARWTMVCDDVSNVLAESLASVIY